MNAADRLRIARGALSRWRAEARRSFATCPPSELRAPAAPWLEAYVYAGQLAALVLRLEDEVAE